MQGAIYGRQLWAQNRKEFLKFGAVSTFSFLLGNQSSFNNQTIAQTSSTDHPNVAIVQRYYQAYGAGQFPGNQHTADTFFWSIYPLKPLPDRLA